MQAQLQKDSIVLPISSAPIFSRLVQRKCSCGASQGLTGKCPDCSNQRLIGDGLQPKLRVSEPGDECEREADQVADRVMGMTEEVFKSVSLGSAQLAERRVAEEFGAAKIQRHEHAGGETTPAPEEAESGPDTAPQENSAVRSAGQHLDESARRFFSARLGHDFSQVRVHADGAAAQSARSINALAYTVGRDIVFDAGRYDPNSFAGRRLLAHELVHVLQQGGARSALTEGAPGNPALIQRQPNSEGPRVRDLPIFLEKLELDVGKNLEDYGPHLYQAAILHPDEPEVLKDAFSRYALGKNVLQTTFKFAGFKADIANKLAVGTGILFKSLTFVREGELTLDFQIDLGRGLKFETNLNLGVDPKNLTDVRKAGVNFGLVRRF